MIQRQDELKNGCKRIKIFFNIITPTLLFYHKQLDCHALYKPDTLITF